MQSSPLTARRVRIRLSREEEAELVARMRQGDLSARDALVDSQIPWVVRLVLRSRPRTEDFEDLVQAGLIVLLECLPKFDPSISRLSSFSTKPIRWRLANARKVAGLIRRPAYRATSRHLAAWHQAASFEELDLHYLPEAEAEPASAERLDELLRLRQAIGLLPDRQYAILVRRLSGHTLAAIGVELGLSKERIRQIESRAVATLRARLLGIPLKERRVSLSRRDRLGPGEAADIGGR